MYGVMFRPPSDTSELESVIYTLGKVIPRSYVSVLGEQVLKYTTPLQIASRSGSEKQSEKTLPTCYTYYKRDYYSVNDDIDVISCNNNNNTQLTTTITNDIILNSPYLNHKCSHDTCEPVNESKAIMKWGLSGSHKIVDDSVYLSTCGMIHKCGKGGDLISPCVIDIKSYKQTGKIICRITGATSEFPPDKYGFDVTSLIHFPQFNSKNVYQFSEDMIKAICKKNNPVRRKSTTTTATVRKMTTVNGGGVKKKKKTSPPTATTTTTTNITTPKQEILSIKDNIAPFNPISLQSKIHSLDCIYISEYSNSNHSNNKKNNINHLKRRKRKTGGGGGGGGGGVIGSNGRNNIIKGISVQNRDNQNNTRTHINHYNLGQGNYNNHNNNNNNNTNTNNTSIDNQKTIYKFFFDPKNLTNLDMLYYRASKNPLLGDKTTRINQSRTILNKLFYSDQRLMENKTTALKNHLKCVKEIYQLHLTLLSSSYSYSTTTATTPPHFDVLNSLAILNKYDTNNMNNTIELEIPYNKPFIDFFTHLCWLQWCVICASQYGMSLIKQGQHLVNNCSTDTVKFNEEEDDSGDDDVFFEPQDKDKSTLNHSENDTNPLNFINCCLTVIYDSIIGQVISNKVIVPKLEYTLLYAPPITDITKYGYKKRMLTKGINQRTMAYISMKEYKEFDLLCNFDFANW